MVISFFGHRDFVATVNFENKILSFLEKNIGDKVALAYLGRQGRFDEFAYNCCIKYKKKHPNLSIVYVTPYITLEYQKKQLISCSEGYDEILYPDIEDKPLRFAITYRNKYVVERSDYVIAYVTHRFGGAYTTYKYALKKGKQIYNLANFQE